MNLIELASQFPDMNVTIRLGDLVEANRELARQAKTEIEAFTTNSKKAEAANVDSCRRLSRIEVCQLLKVSLPTLHRWDKTGYLKPIRIGRKVYYILSDINVLLNSPDHND